MKTLAIIFVTALLSVSGMPATSWAQHKLEYKAVGTLNYKAHTNLESTQTVMQQMFDLLVILGSTDFDDEHKCGWRHRLCNNR